MGIRWILGLLLQVSKVILTRGTIFLEAEEYIHYLKFKNSFLASLINIFFSKKYVSVWNSFRIKIFQFSKDKI